MALPGRRGRPAARRRCASWIAADGRGATPTTWCSSTGRCPAWTASRPLRRIQRAARCSRMPPLVMVTAYGREEVLQRGRGRGRSTACWSSRSSPSCSSTRSCRRSARAVADAPRRRRGARREPAQLGRLRGTRVLLVEDNEINQQVALELLRAAEVRGRAGPNGQEAVRRVPASRFELVLMDLQMPVMDGYRGDPADPRAARVREAADRRHDGQRHGRRPRAVPGRGHERPRGEADRPRRALSRRCCAVAARGASRVSGGRPRGRRWACCRARRARRAPRPRAGAPAWRRTTRWQVFRASTPKTVCAG